MTPVILPQNEAGQIHENGYMTMSMKITRRYLNLTVLLIQVAFSILHTLEPEPLQADDVQFTLLCGPRCALEVLKYYGNDVRDVLEVAKHLDQFDGERGTTLASIARYLESQGVHTKIISLASDIEVDWPYPAIAHLVGGGATGHFIVLMPQATRNPDLGPLVYDGVAQWRRMERSSWIQLRSGVVMLTAPQEIRDHQIAVTRRSWIPGAFIAPHSVCALGLFAFLCLVLYITHWYRRIQPCER